MGKNNHDNHANGREGHVTIAALPSVAATLLPTVLHRFHADYPSVSISILDSFQDNVASAVAQGDADLGISVEPPPAMRLSFSPLIEDRFFAILPRDHPLIADNVRWSDLFAYPFIAMRAMTSVRVLTDHVAAENGGEKLGHGSGGMELLRAA